VVERDATLLEGVVILPMLNQLILGDCREVLKSQPANYFDSVVTDPPSGIAFLGLEWDKFESEEDDPIEGRAELLAFQEFLVGTFKEVYRVLKPGAFGLVWALPRSSHHTMMALERCGFEVRDVICHVFGQGFKKGLDVSKKFDQVAGAKRKVVGTKVGMPGYSKAKEASPGGYSGMRYDPEKECEITAPETLNAVKWEGYHTGLKPAIEFWVLIRKPLDGSVIENILKHGVVALNIDASRFYTNWEEADRPDTWKSSGHTSNPEAEKIAAPPGTGINCHPLGRWPADFILSHSPECRRVGVRTVKGDPRGSCKGTRQGGFYAPGSDSGSGEPNAYVYGDQDTPTYECSESCPVRILDQSGDNSRYFKTFEPEYESNCIYQAKPSTSEKNVDLDEGLTNEHPTVKSLKLMNYLVKLVTPEEGVILEPFAGSGTTLVAAAESGFGFLGIEKDEKTWPALKSRVDNTVKRLKDEREITDNFDMIFEIESE